MYGSRDVLGSGWKLGFLVYFRSRENADPEESEGDQRWLERCIFVRVFLEGGAVPTPLLVRAVVLLAVEGIFFSRRRYSDEIVR